MKTFETEDLTLKLPFNLFCFGASNSGKSEWILKLMEHANTMVSPPPAAQLYCYSQFNKNIPKIEAMGIKTFHGLPSEKDLESEPKPLMVYLDDLYTHMSSDYISTFTTVWSHHMNIGLCVILQTIFSPKLIVARNNGHYFNIMKAPNMTNSIKNFAVQTFGSEYKYFMDAYKQATDENYGYLFVDLSPSSKRDLRLKTKIFPGEDNIVFLPKGVTL